MVNSEAVESLSCFSDLARSAGFELPDLESLKKPNLVLDRLPLSPKRTPHHAQNLDLRQRALGNKDSLVVVGVVGRNNREAMWLQLQQVA